MNTEVKMGFDNSNRGALFKNGRKEADTDPDYNGSLNIAGTEYWVNAWIKPARPAPSS
jgi:hypothetical protein